MTITRSAISTAFQHFLVCVDNAPAGVHEDAKEIRETIGEITDDLIARAKALGLSVCNSDGAFNLEIEIYGYLRAQNEERFWGPEGYGKTFDEADPALQRRINEGLERDRDFLAAVRREGLPYSFAGQGSIVAGAEGPMGEQL